MGFWREIFMALRRNKLRTILTGFSISWGIFMMIVLLAAGNGFMNGVEENFNSRVGNVYTIYSSTTSLPYKGHKTNRFISFTDKDLRLMESGFPNVGLVSPFATSSGMAEVNDKSKQVQLYGVKPIYQEIDDVQMLDGRFLNESDEKKSAKVIVVDEHIKEDMFLGKDPIGEYLFIGSVAYKIIGVWEGYKHYNSSCCFIPFSTLKMIYHNNRYYRFSFTTNGLETKEQNEEFQKFLKHQLAVLHEFSPDDTRGVYIDSSTLNAIETAKIFNTIRVFIWVIGLAMLMSGVVGVSNIMRITVKERTNEIGIRKAIGAKSSSILASIVTEAIMITTVFGYIGMMAGIGLTEIVANILKMNQNNSEMAMFLNPTVDVGVVALATLVLIVSGVAAGFFPARNAVRVKPIEAINYR